MSSTLPPQPPHRRHRSRHSGRALSLSALPALLALGSGPIDAAEPATPPERAIHLEVDVAAPIEEAYAAWSTRDGIRSFFAPDARIELRVGGPFEMVFLPDNPPGSQGGEGNQVLAFDPPRMLAFTWNAPPHLPTVRPQRTHVMLRFRALDAKHTRVSLHHTGWGDGGEWDQAFAYFEGAWSRVLPRLAERFEKGPRSW